MSISKAEINSYRFKNRDLQRRLNAMAQPETLAAEIADVMKNYKEELREKLPINFLQKTGYDLNQDDTLFPKFDSQFLTDEQLSLIKKIYRNKVIYQQAIALRNVQLTILKELEQALDYVKQHQSNWFIMLFVSKDIKLELKKKKLFINQTIWRQNEIEQQIVLLENKIKNGEEAQLDFFENKSDYYDIIAKNIDYDKNKPNQLLTHLNQQTNSIEESILDLDVDFLQEEIKSAWPERKDSIKDLNKSNRQNSDINFLKLVKKRMEISDDVERKVSQINDQLERYHKLISPFKNKSYNDYQVALLDDQTYQQGQEDLQEIIDVYQKILSLKKDLPKKSDYSYSQIKEDFNHNSASYYAIIDQIIGGMGQKTNDLPSFIVEQVEKTEVSKKNFRATLRPYQLFGVQYALYFKKTLLGDEMGLGKTIQALAVANHLYQTDRKHTIIFIPLSVLANWVREIKKWTLLPVNVFRHPEREIAFKNWKREGGLLVLNYEQAQHLVPAIESDDTTVDFVIADEAHMIKNPAAKRSKNTYKVAEKAEYNLFMTGTPLENRLDEMNQLISVLNPELGRSLELKGTLYDSEAYREEVSLIYLRRKRDEVLRELPSIETIEMWSRLSKVEQEYYDDAVRMGIDGMMKMRRAAFYGQSTSRSEKIQQIVDICEEAKQNGDKVLIFSFFKIVLKELKKHIGKDLVGMISGDLKRPVDRQNLIDQFTDAPNGAVLLSQIGAGGVGLNIQAANVVILCEPQWKPSTEQQAIGRVYRMGQTKNVNVFRLLSEETVEETILKLLQQKEDIFNEYAHDSVVSDAFDRKQATSAENSELSEEEIEKKAFEIEVERLKRKTVSA